MGMLEKALIPISSWPLSEVAGDKRNKCSKLRSAAIGLLSLARRVCSENSPSTGLLKAEPKRVVRGEEFKPDSRPSRYIPATLLTSLGEVELKKLWQNKLLQNQQLLNPHLLEEGLLVVVRLILLVAVSGKKTSYGFQAWTRSWIRHWLGMALD